MVDAMTPSSRTWFDPDLKVVRIHYSGPVTYDVVVGMARDALTLAQQHGITHTLAEFFQAEIAFSTAEIFELPQAFQVIALEMGIPMFKIRQAIVVAKGLEDLDFFTTVSNNRGQQARVFGSLDEAMAWLRSAPT